MICEVLGLMRGFFRAPGGLPPGLGGRVRVRSGRMLAHAATIAAHAASCSSCGTGGTALLPMLTSDIAATGLGLPLGTLSDDVRGSSGLGRLASLFEADAVLVQTWGTGLLSGFLGGPWGG